MTDDTPPKWQFSLSLTLDQVYDGFTILSLLKDCITQQKTLVVPHGGEAQDRFTGAVQIQKTISDSIANQRCPTTVKNVPEHLKVRALQVV
jgi:hypothetical protein